MKNMDNYRLEFQQYVNNLDNKRQDYLHTIYRDADDFNYNKIISEFGSILKIENDFFDALGDEDLKKYEKWLEDGEF